MKVWIRSQVDDGKTALTVAREARTCHHDEQQRRQKMLDTFYAPAPSPDS